MDKTREILEELRLVFFGRVSWMDTFLPPILFLIANRWLDPLWAAALAVLIAAGLAWMRHLQGQSINNALGGVAGTILAAAMVGWLGSVEGFFIPDVVTDGLVGGACLLSIIFRRPLAAWASYVTRGWPRDWYWLSKVRPAYQEVTLLWAIYFILRFIVQWRLFQAQAGSTLGVVSLISGTPGLLVVLIVSYLYGSWRLVRLGGPSVEEYESGAEPPWQSQRRGF
ncbi:MAG: DUF3159 domain-containing protein [Anaerolineales bacterium]|jgi:hypothetical protein